MLERLFFYKAHKYHLDKPPIANLSESYITALYIGLQCGLLITHTGILDSLYPIFKQVNQLPLVFICGLLSRDELPGYRAIQLNRVSGSSQGSSLDSQEEDLSEEMSILEDRHDGSLIETYSVTESASTMDRETMNEILEAAKSDEFDILMIWRVHRLTRADPWETIKFILKLKKKNIILYADDCGYFDWSDTDDFNRLTDDITTARDWRDNIVDSSIRGYEKYLEKGLWPYPNCPYGTEELEPTGDLNNGEIVIKDGYGWVYSAVHESFHESVQKENIETKKSRIEYILNDINPRIEAEGKEQPKEHQVEYILENEIFTGKLRVPITEEVIRVKDDLKKVDPELFTKTQRIRRRLGNDEDSTDTDIQRFPKFVYQLIARFGQEYMVSNVSGLRWCCPECQSIDINVSDTDIEQWGIDLPKIYCYENGCNYAGAAIRFAELDEIDYSLPLVCSHCQRTNQFDVEEVTFDEDLYRYTCESCDEFMILNKPPEKTKRALANPQNAIDIHDAKADITESDTPGQQTADTTGSDTPSQQTLDSYI
jgi:DNA invertase Pin-like site-specific DNA recombinase